MIRLGDSIKLYDLIKDGGGYFVYEQELYVFVEKSILILGGIGGSEIIWDEPLLTSIDVLGNIDVQIAWLV